MTGPPTGGRAGDARGGALRLAAFVDLAAVRHNVTYLKSLTPEACGFMAVVKADAYGHGAEAVSRAALEAGADCLGVALVEEGERLRESGMTCPVHLLFEPPAALAPAAVAAELTCSLYTTRFASALSEAASLAGRTVGIHVKVDTGMRRVGVTPGELPGFLDHLAGLRGIRVDGIYTHFAMATEPEDPFTERQMELFERAARAAGDRLGRRPVMHAANSAGVMAFPRSHYDMVRVGIAMLGLPPSAAVDGGGNLRPALSLAGEVSIVKRVRAGEGLSYGLGHSPARDTGVATLPAGYADGFSRALSGRASVLIAGRRRPVVGTICMDTSFAEVGDDPVEAGTPFTIIGSDGSERITADEVAGWLGTINYEVTCMIGGRVPRIYIDGEGRETGDDEAMP